MVPAANANRLLQDKTDRGAKNWLLVAQLFAIISRNRLRAHFGEAVYEYENGSWNPISPSSYGALDYIPPALRAAEGIFLTTHGEGLPARTFQAASSKIALILGTTDKVDIDGYLLDRSANAKDWATESAKMCCAMCKNFTDPGSDKAALGDFARWASTEPPSVENGINPPNF